MAYRNMVIVGAGHAGISAALSLRADGWHHGITIVETQDFLPYERPPLSKSILRRERTIEDYPLLRPGQLQDDAITLRGGVDVVWIDRDTRNLLLSNGEIVDYECLLLATGADARPLSIPGANLADVFSLRNAVDAQRLSERMEPNSHLVVVGGGLIGLEVAAGARMLGCDVTVVEAAPRLMMRTLPHDLACGVQACHEQAGVKFRLGCLTESFVDRDDKLGVCLNDGTVIGCNAVLVCIGALPRVGLAEAAGLLVENGIVVDRYMQTSDPYIFAAGDACAVEMENGRRQRFECWKTANDQARTAARNMLGTTEAYVPAPWFWSDQYDKTIQVAGFPNLALHDVTRHCADGSQLVFHLGENGELVGASGFGSPREVGRGAKVAQLMISRKSRPEPTHLSDPSVELRSLLGLAAA